MAGALSHIRVLDLSRHLAGPWAAQMLADMGAEVIKVERPDVGDDVRSFGPPFLRDKSGAETAETAFFFATNRNKKSVTVDISSPEGQEIIRRLAKQCDVLIENYRVDTLPRYKLGYEDLKAIKPDIVYCSVTGFGQDGPYRHQAGYDSIFQAMGGLMSITGQPDGEPGGGPMKAGFAVADMMTGMYSSIAILGALVHRSISGQGQYIDMALFDVQVAALSIENVRFLLLGEVVQRAGNVSRNMVPTQPFRCQDGYLQISVGNAQFARFIEIMGRPDLAADERFATGASRRKNRLALIAILEPIFLRQPVAHWIEVLAPAQVPCGAVNNIKQVFEDPQVRHRKMQIEVDHPRLGTVPLVANPIKYSRTPIEYRTAPPTLGQDTRAVLRDMAKVGDQEFAELKAKGVI